MSNWQTMNRTALAAIDWFLPAALRTEESDMRLRARFLVGAIVLSLFGALAFLRVSISDGDAENILWAAVRVGLLVPIIVILRRTGALTLTTNWVLAVNYLHLCWATFYFRSINSMMLFSIVPLMALLVVGVRSGLLWLFVVLGTILGLQLSLDLSYIPGAGAKVADSWHVARFLLPLCFCVVTFALVLGYDQMKRRAIRALEQQKQQAIASERRAHENERRALQAEHEREQAKAHTQIVESSRLASLGTLSAGVAHEINNPLAFVMINLECLAGDIEALRPVINGEQYAELGNVIEEMGDGLQRIRGIVRDLRMFSRGAEADVGERVDVRAVLDVALNLTRNQLHHRAEIVKEYGRVPTIMGNEARLVQVFVNLLVNAVQALPAGPADANKIRVSTGIDGQGHVFAEISDTGSGVPVEVQARLFEPFFTTKPKGEGTGLGLSICRHLVQEMDGEISVDSEAGKGSTFRVTLPAVSSITPPAGYGIVQVDTLVPRSARILVVDDEVTVASALARFFQGHEVHTATNGAKAAELLRDDDNFDVIFCDVMMPEVTGIDLYEQMRAQHPEIAKRFVFMTGGTFTERTRTYLERLPVPCIEKPLDVEELHAHVRRLAGPASTRATG